jgi:hypothetical protein
VTRSDTLYYPGAESAGPHAGQIPDLLHLLWSAYVDELRRKIDERRARGRQSKSLQEALQDAPAHHFVAFCEGYLSRHRPVQQFPADGNLGFLLSNNVRALLCPAQQGAGAGPGGQMQDAGAVGVTSGEGQPGMGGISGTGGIPII